MTPTLSLPNLYPRVPLVFGHRGASAYAPENTLEAFQLALAQGADGIELDVALTADGTPVVIHDDTVDRTTNGHGRVGQLTLVDVKALDASYPAKFGAAFRGARLPTLAEVFETVGEQALVNVELKHDPTPGCNLAVRVLEVISARARARQVIVSSFQFSSLRRVKALRPELPVALLYTAAGFGPWLAQLAARGLPHEAEHPSALGLSAGDVARLHQRGLRVNVWTVDDEDRMSRWAAAGVDGIITNRPDVAVRALKNINAVRDPMPPQG